MDKENFALVTGSSIGIGRAIARELASRKYNLILHALPGQGLPELCEELESIYKIQTYHCEFDLTTVNGPQLLFEFVKSKNCSLNILVNNAGIGFEGPIENYDVKDIDYMILLNIRALTHLTHYFVPELKTHLKSYIFFTGSYGCYLPSAYKSIYLASKSYIYYFSRALDTEMKGTPVHTCIIVPSAVRTNKIVLDRIRRNGWFSRKTSLSPEEVARIGIKGMFRGRRVIIPGTFSNLLFVIGLFVPEGVLLMLTRKIFSNYK
jgi:short-subunit dehydrogenase